MKKLLLSLAGGSIPGGLFAAGVAEELAKKFIIKKASGASSGALSGVALMSGHGNQLGNMWLDALKDLKSLTTFNPVKIIRNNSFFMIHDFANSIFKKIEAEGYLKDCRNMLVTWTKLNKQLFSTNKVTITDRLLFPWLVLPSVRKTIGMTTEIADMEKIPVEQRLSFLQASCYLPFFYGLPQKIDSHIAFDGQMNQDLGGAPELLKYYEPGDYVALVFRYETGNPKNTKRFQKFINLCPEHMVPAENIMVIFPWEQLPLPGHYDIDQKNYKTCVDIGRWVAKRHIADIKL